MGNYLCDPESTSQMYPFSNIVLFSNTLLFSYLPYCTWQPHSDQVTRVTSSGRTRFSPLFTPHLQVKALSLLTFMSMFLFLSSHPLATAVVQDNNIFSLDSFLSAGLLKLYLSSAWDLSELPVSLSSTWSCSKYKTLWWNSINGTIKSNVFALKNY